MDNDSPTTPACKGQPEEDRQNRRQFFNGLGKWSLAIIAAVTALRGACKACKAPLVRGSRPARGALANLANRSPRRRNRTGINRILTNRTTIMFTIIETIIVLNDNRAEPHHRVDRRH